MPDATAPPATKARKARVGAAARAALVIFGAVLLSAGAWFAYRHFTYWDRDHYPRQLVVIDDETALLRQDDADGRLRASRVDGSGRVIWARVIDPPDGSSRGEGIVIPVPDARVAMIGTLLGLSIDDGRELWRHPAPQRARSCGSFAVDEGIVVVHCDGEVLAIDAATGKETWRIPFPGRFRWFSAGPGAIAFDHDDAAKPGVVVDIASGKASPLPGRICETAGMRLSLEPKRVTVTSLADPASKKSAETELPDIPAPTCGARPASFIVGRGGVSEAVLHAIDRETLALRWSLKIPVQHTATIDCVYGALLDLDDALPQIVPVRVGSAIYLVDVDVGAVVAKRIFAGVDTTCAAGVAVRDGRAYQLGDGAIGLFDPASPRSIEVDASFWREPAFSKSFIWLARAERVGRLSRADLSPAPGSEWLVAGRTEGAYGAKP